MPLDKVLYTSYVDVSVPYGPAVNERMFIDDMTRRFGRNFVACVPTPRNGIPDDINVENVRYFTRLPNSRGILGWIESRFLSQFKLLREINKFGPDLIVARTGSVPFSQWIALSKSDKPYVVKSLGGIVGVAWRPSNIGLLNRLVSRLDFRFKRKIYDDSILMDIVSADGKGNFVAHYHQPSDKVVLIDNGFDDKKFSFNPSATASFRKKYSLPKNAVVIGYIGNFPMSRGGREVLDMLAHMDGHRELYGVIVGDGGEAEECRRYAQSLGVDDKVLITGTVPYDDVPGYTSMLDIAFSIKKGDEQSSSELKVRQYLASGALVIGSKGSNDFLRDKEFARVVSGSDVKEIEQALREFLVLTNADLSHLKLLASKYAKENLSFSVRNSERLELWSSALRNKGYSA